MAFDVVKAMRAAGMKDIETAAEGSVLRGYLHTGNYALNWIVSGKFQGGWPLGKVVEVFGDPSTGKSYLVARAIAQALQGTGAALLDDTESAFNAIWAAAQLGVDTSMLGYARSHTIEDHSGVVEKFVKVIQPLPPSSPSICALDSVALLSTEEELKGGIKKESMKRAKKIKQFFRLWGRKLADINAVYLVANHTIASMDQFAPTETSGGGGLKFQSTVRVELRRPTKMKGDNGQIVGVQVKAFVPKNRITAPFRACQLIIPFYEAISPVSGLVQLLIDLRVVEVKGRYLVWGPKSSYEGETGVLAQASNVWKQDQSAIELLSSAPDLLSDLDGTSNLGVPASGEAMTEEPEEDEEEE